MKISLIVSYLQVQGSFLLGTIGDNGKKGQNAERLKYCSIWDRGTLITANVKPCGAR